MGRWSTQPTPNRRQKKAREADDGGEEGRGHSRVTMRKKKKPPAIMAVLDTRLLWCPDATATVLSQLILFFCEHVKLVLNMTSMFMLGGQS